jgi:hypothetical protein
VSIRLVLLLVYLSYTLASGSFTKQGSGLDPLGHNPPPVPPTADQGSGLDPMG